MKSLTQQLTFLILMAISAALFAEPISYDISVNNTDSTFSISAQTDTSMSGTLTRPSATGFLIQEVTSCSGAVCPVAIPATVPSVEVPYGALVSYPAIKDQTYPTIAIQSPACPSTNVSFTGIFMGWDVAANNLTNHSQVAWGDFTWNNATSSANVNYLYNAYGERLGAPPISFSGSCSGGSMEFGLGSSSGRYSDRDGKLYINSDTAVINTNAKKSIFMIKRQTIGNVKELGGTYTAMRYEEGLYKYMRVTFSGSTGTANALSNLTTGALDTTFSETITINSIDQLSDGTSYPGVMNVTVAHGATQTQGVCVYGRNASTYRQLIACAFPSPSSTTSVPANYVMNGDIDTTTAPACTVSAFSPQKQTSKTFPVTATVTDAGSTSGIKQVLWQVSVNSAAWTTVTTTTTGSAGSFTHTINYPGDSNNTYGFRCQATDNAGNVQTMPASAQAVAVVPDLDPPSSSVTAVDYSTAIFTVSATASDPADGIGVAHVRFYVSVDGGAATEFVDPVAVRASGTYDVRYNAITDGASHTYRFYTVATDRNSNVEAAPSATDDISVTATFSSPSGLGTPQLIVNKGSTNRSYVRYMAVYFPATTQDSVLTDIVNSIGGGTPRLALINKGTAGSGNTAVSLTGKVTVDNHRLLFDFGSAGITGTAASAAGDGIYEIQIDKDGDGVLETTLHFFRLLGDIDASMVVNSTDINAIAAKVGVTTVNGVLLNEDANGDGVINQVDKTLGQTNQTHSVTDVGFDN